ncbi:gram-negative bacteria-binding protein 3 [Ceratitis capitata]|uniref:gram-negative bacteria-binding protein 3 n=1 Tax=Ceratitis capitata TaxID=7213 RepID=UPI0003296CB0|nr:gram-negative bacteria-binding protein 3 [Ceratitis capitata]
MLVSSTAIIVALSYLTVAAVNATSLGYEVPRAKIEVFFPKGFEVSIPHEEGITLFAFHGKLNEEMEGLEAGTWSRDIVRVKNGRWTFRERNAKLRIGDTLYYWTYVIKDGLGYREDNGVFVVHEYGHANAQPTGGDIEEPKRKGNGSGNTGGSFATSISGGGVGAPGSSNSGSNTVNSGVTLIDTVVNSGAHNQNDGAGLIDVRMDDSCRLSPSCKNGGQQGSCNNQLLFEENFNGTQLDSTHWTAEERFGTKPDHEFALYLNTKDVLQVKNGFLRMLPKLTTRHLQQQNQQLNIKYDIGPNCTGSPESEECVRNDQASKFHAIPPFISAQISTKQHFTFKYGRVEIRAKLPRAHWVFPQLWLQPANAAKYGAEDYQSGQMRIAFSYLNDTQMHLFGGVLLNAHTSWRWVKMCELGQADKLDLGNDFHIYTLIWRERGISLAIDEQTYCQLDVEKDGSFADLVKNSRELPNASLLRKSGNKMAPFDQEYYLTLGYGIGGVNDFSDDLHNWQPPKPWENDKTHAAAMDALLKQVETNFENWLEFGEMLIDYVKVYAI